jgi:XTP/dITP diphosphohydrolase
MDLLIATTNAGKIAELRDLLAAVPARLLSLSDVGLAGLDVAEDADTLEANALAKATAYGQASGLLALADDTGLFVDALGGAPGVYPARYGGPGLMMAERRALLLEALSGVPDAQRTAAFVAVIAIADPRTGAVETVRGACAGRIAQVESNGGGGFGYDPVFIPDGYDVPFSDLPPAEKNRISHRGKAAQAAIPLLLRLAGVR